MLAEAQQVNFVGECNKMQTLSSTHLPELIKSFELKANQQKDVTQVKSGRPAAKMKLRDPREVLEIARLKALISEMREKTMKMEAQLKSVAEKCNKDSKNTSNPVQDNSKDEENERTSMLVQKICRHAMDRIGGNVELTSALDNTQGIHDVTHMSFKGTNLQDFACNVNLVATPESHLAGDTKDLQDISKNDNKNFLVEQGLKLDKDAKELQTHIENLQVGINQMLLELSTRPDLQDELNVAKERIKTLQEDIKDDASTTKAQLLLFKQQFGELEMINSINEYKEREFQKASEISIALEAEMAELKKGNQELLMQKEELSKNLANVSEKAEKIKPVTKDDVLASKAEVLKLRSTNVELQKEMESLQLNRFNDVEEVVYLRWVNACLRHDLDIYKSSPRNSDEISNETEHHCNPDVLGKDDLIQHSNSGHSSSSYNIAPDYPAPQDDSKSMKGEQECGITHSTPISSHTNRAYSSQISTRYNRKNIHVSPLAIPHEHVSSSHSSPLVSPLGHVDGSYSSPLTSPLPHVEGSHLKLIENPHGCLSSHASPQNSLHGVAKTKSGVLHSTQQQSPTNSHLPQSPDAYNPRHYRPGRMVLESDPQKIAEIQSKLTFNCDRSSKLDATSYITALPHNSPRRSGRNITRSTSALSASSTESTNRMQGNPQMHDRRSFMRSSSTLSAESDVSNADHNLRTNSLLRRHSASSGMSLLDEYLQSTNTRSLNRPTSRFSAVLPHKIQFSNFKNVPFPTMKEVIEPLKREDSTGEKAHSFESHLDASNRVVAAFQRLSTSTAKHTHKTFQDLSRQNSMDKKAESEFQQLDKHDVHMSTARSTQADFIYDLARAIQNTQYNSIEQVSAFVSWFERQGEVEKQELFKFPDFPRDKVEAMRRAVYEYEELQALKTELHTHQKQLEDPTHLSVQDTKTLLEKVENNIEGFKRVRELAIVQFTELDIPTRWMLDSGMIAKIKQEALQLAQMFIKRVTKVLTTQAELRVESRERESLLLETAAFLLQVHNFAGGFDEKTVNAFKLLQSQADLQNSNAVCCV